VRRPLRVAFIDRYHGSPEPVLAALAHHYDVTIDATAPEVVFCGEDRDDGHLRHPRALKIWVQHENRYPRYDRYHYVIGYRYRDGDPRWFRWPLYPRQHPERLHDLVRDAGYADRVAPRKTKFCALVASYANPVRVWRRIALVDRLARYKPVDYGGRWRNNVGGPVADKLAFYTPYKFAVAFDNGCMRGYTTEKITDAFLEGCIPVFLGNPDVVGEFNPKSFINAHDCRTLDEVVDRVIALDRDEAQWRRMLAEPCFPANRPNEAFDSARVGAFLHRAIESPRPPLKRVFPQFRLAEAARNASFRADYYAGKLGIPMWGPV
jgi:hypothetical protein